MSNKDRANLLAILDAIEHIENYTAAIQDATEFFENTMVFDATLMNFVVIGEMAGRLSEELQVAHTDIPWTHIKQFRNLIAHNYLGIDAEESWQIITDHIKPLKSQIANIIQHLPE